mgnify:CR=1 FL=1
MGTAVRGTPLGAPSGSSGIDIDRYGYHTLAHRDSDTAFRDFVGGAAGSRTPAAASPAAPLAFVITLWESQCACEACSRRPRVPAALIFGNQALPGNEALMNATHWEIKRWRKNKRNWEIKRLEENKRFQEIKRCQKSNASRNQAQSERKPF